MDLKKIDQTINSICDFIQKDSESKYSGGNEVAKSTFALAELLYVRYLITSLENQSTPEMCCLDKEMI